MRRAPEGGAQFTVPVTTNAKCVDFALAERLRQNATIVECERDLQVQGCVLAGVPVADAAIRRRSPRSRTAAS